MSEPQLTLYYDGACPLCSREVEYYRKRLTGPVVYVDISDPAFDAAQHGVDPVKVQQVLHVKVGEEMRAGVPAFVSLWERLPGQRWLARLAKRRVVNFLLTVGYRIFARLRPLLPRRKAHACTSGTCQTTSPQRQQGV